MTEREIWEETRLRKQIKWESERGIMGPDTNAMRRILTMVKEMDLNQLATLKEAIGIEENNAKNRKAETFAERLREIFNEMTAAGIPFVVEECYSGMNLFEIDVSAEEDEFPYVHMEGRCFDDSDAMSYMRDRGI